MTSDRNRDAEVPIQKDVNCNCCDALRSCKEILLYSNPFQLRTTSLLLQLIYPFSKWMTKLATITWSHQYPYSNYKCTRQLKKHTQSWQQRPNNIWGATVKKQGFSLNIGAMAFVIATDMFMQSCSTTTNLVQMTCTTRKIQFNKINLLELQHAIVTCHCNASF